MYKTIATYHYVIYVTQKEESYNALPPPPPPPLPHKP